MLEGLEGADELTVLFACLGVFQSNLKDPATGTYRMDSHGHHSLLGDAIYGFCGCSTRF